MKAIKGENAKLIAALCNALAAAIEREKYEGEQLRHITYLEPPSRPWQEFRERLEALIETLPE